MLLIKTETHDGYYHELQEQSWQTENWLGGEWLTVPDVLREKVWACAGCCDLITEDGELVDVTPKERPIEPEPPVTNDKYTPEEKNEFIEGLMEGLGL